MDNKTIDKGSLNRAKPYQLALFPFNNGATNVYYVLTMTYIAYYGNGVLGLALVFATTMVTLMRVFDAVTDPIIGAIMDRTAGKLGKFRPFMVIGNLIMAISAILLYFGTRIIPEDMMGVRYLSYVLIYAVYVIGYTCQTSVTRSGQTVLTNDPSQRPMFTIFNLVASMIGMGTIQFLAPIIRANVGDYTTEEFFNVIIPIA
ncbi:MAG: MFS transporter, partial [Butyrivibrio sp.]|nr:MFS transporter [Butyrivibrio sp.]